MEKISMNVELDLGSIAFCVARELCRDDVINFIKEIDSLIGDWDFTLNLFEWLKKQKEEYDKELKDYGEEVENERF